MKPTIWDETTEQLLREKGLKCICQLCDCGGPHRHPNCRLPFPKVFYSMCQQGNNKLESDYQSRFRAYDVTAPPQSMKPLEKSRDPNPPPMDFRTENNAAYTTFNNAEKRKPCKLKGELDKLHSGDFQGNTLYKESFPGHQPQPVGIVKPKPGIKSDNATFYSETEYSKGFPKKEKIPQECYREKPEGAYHLLYPSNSPVPKHSVMNAIHDGRRGEKTKSFAVRESNVKLGNQDKVELTTTNSVEFKKYDDYEKVQSMRPKTHIIPRKKFDAKSRNKTDFGYDENEAAKAKAKLCPEYPSTIKLSMDIPVDFKTIAGMSYNNWKAKDIMKERSVNPAKPTSRYTPPKTKFDAVSQSHKDFVDYGVNERTQMARPVDMRKSSAKINGQSSYQAEFLNHKPAERKLYGEQNEDNLQLPSKTEKFQNSSVMKNDFQNFKNSNVRKPFKPTYSLHNRGGEFSGDTEYRETFKLNEIKPCSFITHMANAQARRNQRLNTGTVP